MRVAYGNSSYPRGGPFPAAFTVYRRGGIVAVKYDQVID